MFKWIKGKTEVKEEPPKPKARKSLFSTHEFDGFDPDKQKFKIADSFATIEKQQPALYGEFAMDDSSNGIASFKMYDNGINTISDAVIGWYASQGFIGAQLCGILAQNWLINKACSMPADDAIRKGYNVVTVDGDELDPAAVKIIKAYDKAFKLNYNMREFIRKGRIFGIRIAMFKVQSTDPQYYEKPFNIDGITPGSYKGIVQVDPYWTAPMLDGASASQPDTLHFYEPTWWLINGKKIHRSHLIIFRHAEPVDVLKPQYIYGGVPLTQQIMERVYAAERTSNEAPQLAMSKRTTIWLTDIEAVMSDTNATVSRLQQWAAYRDNYGVKLGDKEGDEFQQFDTSLADFDSLIMTQYQLVAAIANVPSTKLMGTQPKGFGASGDYEEASYHELLESIQTHDLTPFAERHHQLVIKSFVEPQLGVKLSAETTLNWLPLDTPTAEELAQTNLLKAQVGAALIEVGAVSSEEERQRVATDKTSGYNEIGLEDEMPEAEELADEDLLDTQDQNFYDPEVGGGSIGKKFAVAQDADDEKWITVNGTHILVNGKGDIIEGPAGLKKSKSTSAKESGGTLADKAYALSSKGASKEAMQAHIEAAQAYKNEGQHENAERHESMANGHKEKLEQAAKENVGKYNSGNLADAAYALSSKGASKEAMQAHIEAAEAYEAEGNSELASSHKHTANWHLKEIKRKLNSYSQNKKS